MCLLALGELQGAGFFEPNPRLVSFPLSRENDAEIELGISHPRINSQRFIELPLRFSEVPRRSEGNSRRVVQSGINRAKTQGFEIMVELILTCSGFQGL